MALDQSDAARVRVTKTAQVMLQNLKGAANARGRAAHGIALPQRGIDASQSGWKIRIVRGCAAQIFARWFIRFVVSL